MEAIDRTELAIGCIRHNHFRALLRRIAIPALKEFRVRQRSSIRNDVRGRSRRNWATVAASCALSATCLSTMVIAAGPVPCGVALPVADVLQRLNAVRASGKTCHAAGPMTVGAPLIWSEGLAAAAMTQSREMAALNRMSHRDSENRNLGERLRAQGYVFKSAAENVAVGYPSFEEVIDAWLHSEGHCENLMSGVVLELGLACIDGTDIGIRSERRFWTLVLAAPSKPR